ncbi:hypothetical protein EZMO1_0871 [Endozoicomonas montiporae CL-33]|uniref:Uncharacterized protein n=1 Tax=Endozoicomonas montiporae CL-33 TaxID=570277 RepID=A0A142B8L3_9GAMM|nr:hypothetical protein EZMO1_0871 [Endozoicomonas montiporae CL-33]
MHVTCVVIILIKVNRGDDLWERVEEDARKLYYEMFLHSLRHLKLSSQELHLYVSHDGLQI